MFFREQNTHLLRSSEENKMAEPNFSTAVGRRKEAVARVRLLAGNGPLSVNGKVISEYFRGPIFQKRYQLPFEVTKTLGEVTGTVKVSGGGLSSQLGAVVHGIARALDKMEKKKNHLSLKKAGLLTRDARVKERRKYGHAQKARAKKQSPKR